jgi:hypothetical protein
MTRAKALAKRWQKRKRNNADVTSTAMAKMPEQFWHHVAMLL